MSTLHNSQDGRIRTGYLLALGVWMLLLTVYLQNWVIAVLGTLFALLIADRFRWLWHRFKMRSPFRLESVAAGDGYVDFQVYVKVGFVVRQLQVWFTTASGPKPKITAMQDFGTPNKAVPPFVSSAPYGDGSWYWRYSPPEPRAKRSLIKIRIVCKSDDIYEGNIRVKITLDEPPWVAKEESLPIKIKPASQSEKDNNVP